MHIDDRGQHCLIICPDQFIYNQFDSGRVTKFEIGGFTCCATTWINKIDNNTFEALYGYRNGEIWHACYEV